jgi:hypothetical protein
MNLRHLASCGLLGAVLVLTGCEEGRVSPGRVTVQLANAAPGFETLRFRREQENPRSDSVLAFKGTQALAYDADTYDFFIFETTTDVNNPGRTWTFAPTLEPSTHYTFVLTEVAGEVQPVILTNPAPPTADAQIGGFHAATGMPAMDLYLERPGVGIAGATPRGTFGALEQMPARTLPSGEYELTLTAAGNPADVLLSSTTIVLPAGATSMFIVVAEAGQGSEPLSVLLLQAVPSLLYDRNATSELRVINAANDREPRDFAVDSQFSPPLFSAMPFGEPTAYAPMPLTTALLNVTPVGNPGVLELNQNFTGIVGQRATMLFNGPAGTLTPAFIGDDGRRINRQAKMRFMNAAYGFIAIDFVLTLPGGDPLVAPVAAQLFTPGMAAHQLLPPGEYDLYLYQAGTPTVLSGPTRIDLAAEGIYGVLAIDGPDTATANVLLLDDFP